MHAGNELPRVFGRMLREFCRASRTTVYLFFDSVDCPIRR
jgi:hypothetical protein